MQKLLWIGQEGFGASLQECGWNTAFLPTLNFNNGAAANWQELVGACGFEPDVLVVSATSPFLRGMERFPCFTALYLPQAAPPEWAVSYSAGFDVCAVAASDFVPHFQQFLPATRVLWSPPHAVTEKAAFAGMAPGCLFMEEPTPKMAEFLARLAEKGIMPERKTAIALPAGRLILTADEPGKFGSRLLDYMGNGCCVVSPRVGNGMEKLFVDGEHFVGYADMDAGDAAYRLNFLLRNPDLVEHIGRSAREAINGGHRAIHRAWAFTDFLCDLLMDDPGAVIGNRLSQADSLGAFIEPVYYLGN